MSPPSGSYKAVDVQCPFFKRDDGSHRITCEGLIGTKETSGITLWYKKKTDYETQISTFCCEHYKKCEIYGVLIEKYEDDNE